MAAAAAGLSPEQQAALLQMTPAEKANFAYQFANIKDDRGHDLLGTAISMAILTTLAIIGRMAARRKMRVVLSWDDYTMLAGFVCAPLAPARQPSVPAF